jgi:hypothetical protein
MLRTAYVLRIVHYDEEATRREIVRLGLDGRVRLEPPVPVDDLVPALSSYDVGLITTDPARRTRSSLSRASCSST